jgi:hypothetical protein
MLQPSGQARHVKLLPPRSFDRGRGAVCPSDAYGGSVDGPGIFVERVLAVVSNERELVQRDTLGSVTYQV